MIAHKPMFCEAEKWSGIWAKPIWLVSYFIKYEFPDTKFTATEQVVQKFKEKEQEKAFDFYIQIRNQTEYWKRNKQEIEPFYEEIVTQEFITNLKREKKKLAK